MIVLFDTSVIVAAAKRAGCSRIYSYNVKHYRQLCPDDMIVSAP